MNMKQRLGRPATRAEALRKRRDFYSALATSGGGHFLVPQMSRAEFRILLAPGATDNQFVEVNDHE